MLSPFEKKVSEIMRDHSYETFREFETKKDAETFRDYLITTKRKILSESNTWTIKENKVEAVYRINFVFAR